MTEILETPATDEQVNISIFHAWKEGREGKGTQLENHHIITRELRLNSCSFFIGKRAHGVGETERETRLEKGGQIEEIRVHTWRFKVHNLFCIFF